MIRRNNPLTKKINKSDEFGKEFGDLKFRRLSTNVGRRIFRTQPSSRTNRLVRRRFTYTSFLPSLRPQEGKEVPLSPKELTLLPSYSSFMTEIVTFRTFRGEKSKTRVFMNSTEYGILHKNLYPQSNRSLTERSPRSFRFIKGLGLGMGFFHQYCDTHQCGPQASYLFRYKVVVISPQLTVESPIRFRKLWRLLTV